MAFDSKRRRVDEEPPETDDDVQVVHDIPYDGHDTGDGGAKKMLVEQRSGGAIIVRNHTKVSLTRV
jgi:hypothetical protein